MNTNYDQLTEKTFNDLSSYIYKSIGVKISPIKKSMIESRLRKRLLICNLSTYKDYFEFLKSKEGQHQEFEQFVHVVTTHKTDFFREQKHFDFLLEFILPKLISSSEKNLTLWSAACSRGDEIYSLAMLLQDYLEKHRVNKNLKLFASDISKPILDEAIKGIYNKNIIAPIPMSLRKKYLLKSKDPTAEKIRIHPKIRNKITFFIQNLIDEEFKIQKNLDIIFLRNVMIYFDGASQNKIIHNICRYIRQGGYLVTGHSEVLNLNHFPLRALAPTVYQVIR